MDETCSIWHRNKLRSLLYKSVTDIASESMRAVVPHPSDRHFLWALWYMESVPDPFPFAMEHLVQKAINLLCAWEITQM